MTDKQLLFCEEYLKDFNATQAAIRAGYSAKTAYSIANENLKKPEIRNYIELMKMDVSQLNKLSIVSLINDVSLIKEKCLHGEFDANNALKACTLLSKFLLQAELMQREFVQRMSTVDLDALATTLLIKKQSDDNIKKSL